VGSGEIPLEEPWNPDDYIDDPPPVVADPAPPEAIFDDGFCPRMKISICPTTYKRFWNRCKKQAFHKAGCEFATTGASIDQPTLPGFLPQPQR
jgi:hypothetical protein